MNQSIQLKMKKLPKLLGELTHSNQFLKLSVFSAYLLCGLLITLVFFQAIRPAPVLTLAPDASLYQSSPKPKPEIEIERAVREYMKLRYNWEPKTVEAKVSEAEAFILSPTRKAYATSMVNVIRFSKEKIVAQRVYPETIKIDLKKSTAIVLGDRITSIQGLKAAGDLKLQLALEYGERTATNPWGVYIAKEIEEN